MSETGESSRSQGYAAKVLKYQALGGALLSNDYQPYTKFIPEQHELEVLENAVVQVSIADANDLFQVLNDGVNQLFIDDKVFVVLVPPTPSHVVSVALEQAVRIVCPGRVHNTVIDTTVERLEPNFSDAHRAPQTGTLVRHHASTPTAHNKSLLRLVHVLFLCFPVLVKVKMVGHKCGAIDGEQVLVHVMH